MGIRVVSKRAGGVKPVAGETVVYIGRPSVLGNPFPMQFESQRASVVAAYRKWLQARYSDDASVFAELHQLADRVKAGESIALQCWCAPCACHGDVIIDAINWINSQQ